MKNITLKIDDETYRKARIRAAHEGTSVSAMVKEFLAKQADEKDERESRRVAALNEFTVNARNASKSNFTAQRENDWLSCWLLFPVAPLTVDAFLTARLIHSRYQVSHRDSLILASARKTGCTIVYS